jgi:hypothetical protein
LEPNEQVPELKPQHLNLNTNRWLMPTLFGIVAILSVVFYFRNCDPVRSPQFAVPSPKTETLEPGTRNPESETVSSQRPALKAEPEGSAVSSPDTITSPPGPLSESERGNRGSGGEGGEAELKPQNLNLKTHLFQLAREVYGNPFLWVLIYRANPGKISNPDQVVVGSELTIPVLGGTPQKLTRADSLNVSDGYRLVYEYYLSKGDARAAEFRQVMLKYKPE